MRALPTRHSATPLHLLALNCVKRSDEIMADVNLVLDSFEVDVNQQDEGMMFTNNRDLRGWGRGGGGRTKDWQIKILRIFCFGWTLKING